MDAAKFTPPLSSWTPLCSKDIHLTAKNLKNVYIAPEGFLMTEGLAAALQDQGKTLTWLRLDTMDCDPASCLIDITQAAQRVIAHIGANIYTEMQRLPGPIFGWSHIFAKIAEEFEQYLPPTTAVVIEGLEILAASNPPLTKNILTFLNNLPQEMSRLIVSQEVLPNELILDWDQPLQVNSMSIQPDSCREAAEELGIQLTNRCIQLALKLSGGSATIFLGLLEACRELGHNFVENLMEHTSNQEMLLKKLASSWLSCSTPEEIYASCLTLEIGYFHPEINQAVFGPYTPKSCPWFQPLHDDWQHLRSIWQAPLEFALRVNSREKRELLLLAANFLKKRNAFDLAMKIYLNLNEFNSAAELLASSLEEILNTGQWLNLKRWLNEIPENILKDWPWLIYAWAEIEAMEGSESRAYTYFSIASNSFARQNDTLGLSYTLLGKSILDKSKSDLTNAFIHARKSHSIAHKYGFEEQQAWADYQLALLSATTMQVSEASEYVSSALSNTNDSQIAELIINVQNQIQEYDQLLKIREHYLHQIEKVEDSIQEGGQKIKSLWGANPDYLPILLEKYGWLSTPLMYKLPTLDNNFQASHVPGEHDLIKRLLRKLGLNPNKKKDTITNFQIVQELPLPLEHQSSTTPLKTTQDAEQIFNQIESIIQPDQVEPITKVTQQRRLKNTKAVTPILTVYCLGTFRVYQDEKPVEEWFSGKGKAIFKYLVTHRERPVAKEIMMEIFWPDTETDAARNNLNVAIYSLRQALRLTHPSYSHVIFQNECYMLNPTLDIWLDSELFIKLINSAKSLEKIGGMASAIDTYNNAEALYQGEFMEENRYDDWPKTQRQYLLEEYIKLLDRVSKYYFDESQFNPCLAACNKILAVDPCREEAHRLIMQCFHLQDQPYLALRQYHQCVEALKNELQVDPSTKTTTLYNRIRKN